MSKLGEWLEKVDKDTSLDGTFYWQAISVIEKLKEALEQLTYAAAFMPDTQREKLTEHCNKALAIDPESL